jgi:hypothetical protein
VSRYNDVRLTSMAPAGRRTLERSPTISYFFSCPTPSLFSFLFSFLFFLCLLLFKSVFPGSKCVACSRIAYFSLDRVVEINQKRFRTNPEFASVHNKVFGFKIVRKYCGYQINWNIFLPSRKLLNVVLQLPIKYIKI